MKISSKRRIQSMLLKKHVEAMLIKHSNWLEQQSRIKQNHNYLISGENDEFISNSRARRLHRNTINRIRYQTDAKLRMRVHATNLANHAQRIGIIKQQRCSKCGSFDTEKHHPDYDKPLDIVWLCKIHHSEEHKKNKG